MTSERPVLILQQLSADGPAYLGHWLAARGITADVRNAEAGDAFPDSLEGYRAMAILGGEMSANDPLPALRRAEALFLEAVERGVPTLGHCLGGQLMARALGARIGESPAPEVGWHAIEVLSPESLARDWFGDVQQAWVFQWHYEAFELPAGARRLAGGAACPHQAFAFGPHLGMQFHVEIDVQKHERWIGEQGARYLAAMRRHPTVHDGPRMRADAARHMKAHQALAARIYQRWLNLAGLAQPGAAGFRMAQPAFRDTE